MTKHLAKWSLTATSKSDQMPATDFAVVKETAGKGRGVSEHLLVSSCWV